MRQLTTLVLILAATAPVLAAAPPGSHFDGDLWCGYFGSPYYKGWSAGGDLYWFPAPWVSLVGYYDQYRGESGYFDSTFGGTTFAGGCEFRTQTTNNLNLLLLAGRRSYRDTDSVNLYLSRLRFNAGTLYGELTGQFIPGGHRAEAEIGPEWRRPDHSLALRVAALYIHDQAKELVQYEYDQFGGRVRWKPDPTIEIQGQLLYNMDRSQEPLDPYWSGAIVISLSPFYLDGEGAR